MDSENLLLLASVVATTTIAAAAAAASSTAAAATTVIVTAYSTAAVMLSKISNRVGGCTAEISLRSEQKWPVGRFARSNHGRLRCDASTGSRVKI
ncbi:hypothetical protein CKAN_02175800 [Cinnamomum micranthum f. kanehirae]|uniref:Uncharacterized protein n=1 Tax=Cinnamomum micranthum f. kanehirae TaxID=337451 RepID=A0A443PP31_9MAGN|nr:hypothetical protein CKAN_02175800 [Cinnamomum micranthum f. kanehirae]